MFIMAVISRMKRGRHDPARCPLTFGTKMTLPIMNISLDPSFTSSDSWWDASEWEAWWGSWWDSWTRSILFSWVEAIHRHSETIGRE